MRVYCAKNYKEASTLAADLIAAQILLKPDSVLGLATGSTPIGAYQRLIAKYEAGELDFSQVKTMNLDEYRGLDGEKYKKRKHQCSRRKKRSHPGMR